MKKKIFEVLNMAGVACHLSGRDYLERAVEMVYANEKISITKELYPTLAREYGSSPQRVDRDIRHSIENAFGRTNKSTLIKLFGSIVDENTTKIANSEFIFGLVKYLKVHYEVN